MPFLETIIEIDVFMLQVIYVLYWVLCVLIIDDNNADVLLISCFQGVLYSLPRLLKKGPCAERVYLKIDG